MKTYFGSQSIDFRFDGSRPIVRHDSGSGGFDLVTTFTPVARWDFVTRRAFVDGETIRPGVVADSVNAIASVKFYLDGVLVDTVTSPTLNPDSGELEYWITVDTTGMSTGASNAYEGNEYVLTAEVLDTGGQTRTLSAASTGFDWDEIKFRVVSSKITYWMEPGATGGDGSELNPFGNVSEAFAAYELVAGYGTPYGERNAPLVLNLKPGTYGRSETYFVNPENAFQMRTMIEFRNPSETRDDVVLSGEIGEPNLETCFHFYNLKLDASDVKENGTETGTDTQIRAQSNAADTTKMITFYESCYLTSEKQKNVRINGVFSDEMIPILRYQNGPTTGFGINCTVYNFGAKPFSFARNCSLERILEDGFGTFCLLSTSISDLSSTLAPRGYVDDLHGDIWQDFWPESAALPKENIFLRDLTTTRCHGQGFFLSGGVSLFDGIAAIDCDFTNDYIPSVGSNGVVDQIALADDGSYDNTQIKNDFLSFNSRRPLENAVIKNCTFKAVYNWASLAQSSFDPTGMLWTDVFFVDCTTDTGDFFVINTRDGQSFASQSPDMSAPFSEWRSPIDSTTGVGAYYRTTSGVS